MTRLIGVLRRTLEWLTAMILAGLMLLTFADVVGRYFFAQPLPGGHVLVQCLVCMLVFTGLPIVVKDDKHLRVRLLDARMASRWQHWRDVAVSFVTFACLAVLAGQMYWQAGYFTDNGEYFESIRIPLAWMAWYAAAVTTIAAVFAAGRLATGVHGAEDRE